MKTVVLVIAKENFRDEEYFQPKELLEKNNIKVITASSVKGSCIGKLSGLATSDITLNDVDLNIVDGLFFIGGPGSREFFHDEKAHSLLTDALICAAPRVLAFAGLLKDKRSTAFFDAKHDLISNGAIWTGTSVEIDGMIITANGPESASDFGQAIVDNLL